MRPVVATWAFEARLVCTVLLYICVRGDSTLRGNYTTITSSLIKLRATRLIQPCDPAVRAHSSLHCSDIIQSVLQRRTANWWCCYFYGSVSHRVWSLTSITCHNFQLLSDVSHFVQTDKVWILENSFESLFWVIQLSKEVCQTIKMNGLAFEKVTPATTHIK